VFGNSATPERYAIRATVLKGQFRSNEKETRARAGRQRNVGKGSVGFARNSQNRGSKGRSRIIWEEQGRSTTEIVSEGTSSEGLSEERAGHKRNTRL